MRDERTPKDVCGEATDTLYLIHFYTHEQLSFLQSGFYRNQSRHGNVTTPLRFLFIFVFLCTRSFFLINRLREYVPAIIASSIAKFEQIL